MMRDGATRDSAAPSAEPACSSSRCSSSPAPGSSTRRSARRRAARCSASRSPRRTTGRCRTCGTWCTRLFEPESRGVGTADLAVGRRVRRGTRSGWRSLGLRARHDRRRSRSRVVMARFRVARARPAAVGRDVADGAADRARPAGGELERQDRPRSAGSGRAGCRSPCSPRSSPSSRSRSARCAACSRRRPRPGADAELRRVVVARRCSSCASPPRSRRWCRRSSWRPRCRWSA